MGIIADITGGNLLSGIKGLIEQFHASPEVKAQMQQALDANALAVEQCEKDWDVKLNDIAGQNIRTETSSTDWVVRRARPIFLWVVTTGIACNILIFPLINVALHKGLVYPDIPAPILELFGTVMLGYTVARSAEKLKDKD